MKTRWNNKWRKKKRKSVWEKMITRLSMYNVGSEINKKRLSKNIKVVIDEKSGLMSQYFSFLEQTGFIKKDSLFNQRYIVTEKIPSDLHLIKIKQWIQTHSSIKNDDSIESFLARLKSIELLKKIKGGQLMVKIKGEKLEKIKIALNRTWQVIGGDCLQETDSMSRDEVCEVVLDANYIDHYGNLDKELLKEFQNLTYEERLEIAEQAFPFASYSI